MRLGFSYPGFFMLLALFLPNLLWTKRKPKGYEQAAAQENKVLRALERTGQGLTTVFSLIFSEFNPDIQKGLWNLWLLGAAAVLLFYELYWIRYFRSGRTMADFYSSFCGIPLAGATLPVAAFFLLAVYGKNILLAGAVLLLAIGHIGIHYQAGAKLRRAYALSAKAKK